METQTERLPVGQKQVWNKLAQGREKWHDFMMNFLKPMGDEIISALALQDSDTVLDLATGTGEPGLSIARMVHTGKVIGADISPDMLEIARAKALEKGIFNYETIACEAGNLPFEDNTFDGVSCRNGFMFFADLQKASREIYRVLKPGTRMAISVWGSPAKNRWITTPMGVINKYLRSLATYEAENSMFRCAESDLITQICKDVGFKKVMVRKISGKVSYSSSAQYWQFVTEVTAPVALAMSQIDEEKGVEIRKKVVEMVQKEMPEEGPVFDYEALIICGEK